MGEDKKPTKSAAAAGEPIDAEVVAADKDAPPVDADRPSFTLRK